MALLKLSMQCKEHRCTHIWYMSQETLQNPKNSAEMLLRFHNTSVQLTVELQYYFCGECLPFLQNTSLSAEWYFVLRGFVFTKLRSIVLHGMPLLYTNMAHKPLALVATYVRYTLCSLLKPSSAGDSKTTVATYAAAIHTLHYSTHFTRCLWRSTATYTIAMTIPPFRPLQANYPLTILGIQYNSTDALWRLWLCWCPSSNPQTPFDNFADTLWRFHGHPLTILQTPLDNSADTLWWFHGYPQRCHEKLRIPTQWIRRFRKVSCNMYRS